MKNYQKTLAALLLTASVMTSANAEIIGKNYAEIRTGNSEGWTIQAFFNGNSFHSCGATTADSVAGMDEMILELAGPGSDYWLIGRNGGSSDVNYQGKIFVGPVQDTLSFEPVGTSVFKMVAPLQRSVVAEIKRGASLTVQWDINDQYRANYSLSGSTAAMLKTEECVQNQGRKRTTQRRQPQPRVAQQPQPRRNTVQARPRRQNNAPQKAVLSGTWRWVDSTKNNRDRNIISTIELTGSGKVRYCYGFPCWDVDVRQDGNSYTFSIDGVSMFQFWDKGTNVIEGRYWGSFGTNNPPDATVIMN